MLQTLPQAFSHMRLRSGTSLGNIPGDEPLWNIDSPFYLACDLEEFPPSFQRTYSQFSSMCLGFNDVWSPNAALAFSQNLERTVESWAPVAIKQMHYPDSAGIIALRILELCSRAASMGLAYPNTRSYALDSEHRADQAAIFNQINSSCECIFNEVRLAYERS